MEFRLVVTYDISDDKLRTRVHKFLRNYGINSQKSVFEMIVGETEYRKVLEFLRERIHEGNDSARVYQLCRGCLRKAHILGEGLSLNTLAYEII